MEQRATRSRLAWSTAIFSLATGLSRVLGLVREMVAAYYFGAAGKINAFTVAFQIPNLIRALVADAALSSAFVPVFSELLEKGEQARLARRVEPLLADAARPRRSDGAVHPPRAAPDAPVRIPVDLDLAVGLSRVLFPIVALLGVSGIIVGILNSYEEFTIPALTPVVLEPRDHRRPRARRSARGREDAKLYVYAVSILVGTVIQVLLAAARGCAAATTGCTRHRLARPRGARRRSS